MIVYIKPLSLFPSLHSDTVFGALCVAFNDLYGINIRDIADNPSFVISSPMPYVEFGEEKVHFFPKPIEESKRIEEPIKYFDEMKKMKNVTFVDEKIFNDWINGRINGENLIKNLDRFVINQYLLSERRLDFEISSIEVPRNVMNRFSQVSEGIFYTSGLSYKNCGLFLMVKFFKEEFKSKIKGAMRFLEDRGFGRDFSVGFGQFKLDGFSNKNPIEEPNGRNRFITLSRYHPTPEEIKEFSGRAWYEFVSKRGRRTSDGNPKKNVFFFVEGSTFPDLGKERYGKNFWSTPDCVEYGLAYDVGMVK